MESCVSPVASGYSSADLEDAILTGANLTNANFIGADLEDVDFSGADVTGAIGLNR